MKIKLYFDTIKRISLNQNFFLVKEKVFKKILPMRIKSFEEVESNLNLDKQLNSFKKNLAFLKVEKNNENLWDLGVSGNKFQHHYHSYVYDILKKYNLSENIDELERLWETTHDDIEFIYNLQRMYKLKEIMDSLIFTDKQKLSVIISWIERFPPQKGVSWMGFNCSIRLINWVKIFTSLEDFVSVDNKDIKIIFLSMLQNIEFIEKNIEHHIPGNHVIFQYFSLWLITFLFEDGRKDKYSRLFEKEFINEFHESGLHFELSTHYHLQVLQLGVYYSLINFERNQIPKLILNIIEKAYYILDMFSHKENHLPLVGDNCYNFFHNNLVEDAENLNYLRELLKIETRGKSNINEIKNEYLIAEKNKFKVIFDVGNISMSQNPGHGHSDIFSIIISYNGIPIFTDPGTRRYSNLPENLELKRSSSHNTISVNGEDQAKLWGFFRWAFLPDKPLYHYSEDENLVTLEGKFKGFKNIGGAIHSRKIVIYNNSILVSDIIKCKNLNRVESNFVLSELATFSKKNGKYYLQINNYKFKFSITSPMSYHLDIIPQMIYPSYDNPVHSNKIKIFYESSGQELETVIELKLVNA